MEHLDEGTIHAWLDGELTPEQRREIERHTGACAACTASVAEARGFIAASSRILSALDGVPGGVVPVPSAAADAGSPPADDLAALRAKRRAGTAAATRQRPWWRRPGFAAAAAAAFVAAGSLTVIRLLPNGGEVSVAKSGARTSLESFRASSVAVDTTAARRDEIDQLRKAEAGSVPSPQSQPVSAEPVLARKKESVAPAADAAPPPAQTLAAGAARADAPPALNELKAAQVPAAPARPTEANADRAKARAEERIAPPLTAMLAGCYAIRLVAVGGGPMAIAAVRLPTHIALDSPGVPVPGGTAVQYEARDVSPDAERTAGVYRWRPTGDGTRSFDLLIVGDNGTQSFAAVVGGNPTAAGGPVTPMPAGAPVRLAAVRERCR